MERLRRLLGFRRRAAVPAGCLRVCFLGDGTSGSWRMRAAQVAGMRAAWVARATQDLDPRDIDRHDLFCFVKRFDRGLATRLRSGGKVVLYDVVDPWKQPEDGDRYKTLPEIVGFFRQLWRDLPVEGVIFPNATMKKDLGHLVPNPTVIYHHHRPELRPVRVRDRAPVVGYEGVPDYLGPWRQVVQRACTRHALRFVVNPRCLTDLDIGFAARGGPHGSLLASRYKSNVKLANFFAAGIPSIVHADEMSYRETDNGKVLFFRTDAELDSGLETLLPVETRREIQESFLSHSRNFSLATIAEQYEAYFLEVRRSARAA